jgi:hypothetical protein
MIGGQHTVAASAKALDSTVTTACRQITIRANAGTSIMYFGGSDVTAVPANAHGYLNAGESWTFGPFSPGSGIKPSDIYIIGTASDVLFWSGIPS